MIHGVHIEVILAGGYAMLLVGVAGILELVARHAHHRSEHFRNSGFTYKKQLDVWQCPTGHHLTREQTDFERKISEMRANKPKKVPRLRYMSQRKKTAPGLRGGRPEAGTERDSWAGKFVKIRSLDLNPQERALHLPSSD